MAFLKRDSAVHRFA